MFCKHCGERLEDNTSLKFCTYCGAILEKEDLEKREEKEDFYNFEEDLNSNEEKDKDFKKKNSIFEDLFKKIIISPYKAINNCKEKLSNTHALVYSILCITIISLLAALTMKALNNYMIEFYLGQELKGLITIEQVYFINEILKNILSPLNIFLGCLITLIIFYLIINLFNYIIFSLIYKKDIKFMDYTKTELVAILFHTLITIILVGLFLIKIHFNILLILGCIFYVMYMVILYETISNLIKNRSLNIYIFPIVYITSNFISLLVIYKLILLYINIFITIVWNL